MYRRIRYDPTLPRIEPIQVHHLAPRGNEGSNELLLRIRASIDFCESTQLRVGAENQIGARGCPLELTALGIAALIHRLLLRSRRPLRVHVEQVLEEVIGQRLRLLREPSVFALPN